MRRLLPLPGLGNCLLSPAVVRFLVSICPAGFMYKGQGLPRWSAWSISYSTERRETKMLRRPVLVKHYASLHDKVGLCAIDPTATTNKVRHSMMTKRTATLVAMAINCTPSWAQTPVERAEQQAELTSGRTSLRQGQGLGRLHRARVGRGRARFNLNHVHVHVHVHVAIGDPGLIICDRI
jgi:hypothetical protein